MLSEAGLGQTNFAVRPQHTLDGRGGGFQVRNEEKPFCQTQQHGRSEVPRQNHESGWIRLATSQISIG
jgi:hypothetical protein